MSTQKGLIIIGHQGAGKTTYAWNEANKYNKDEVFKVSPQNVQHINIGKKTKVIMVDDVHTIDVLKELIHIQQSGIVNRLIVVCNISLFSAIVQMNNQVTDSFEIISVLKRIN